MVCIFLHMIKDIEDLIPSCPTGNPYQQHETPSSDSSFAAGAQVGDSTPQAEQGKHSPLMVFPLLVALSCTLFIVHPSLSPIH